MAIILACEQCNQPFEIPEEHEQAPALQCPFCANIVQNVAENRVDGGMQAPDETQVHSEAEMSAAIADAASLVTSESELESPFNAKEARNPFPFAGKSSDSATVDNEVVEPFIPEPEPEHEAVAIKGEAPLQESYASRAQAQPLEGNLMLQMAKRLADEKGGGVIIDGLPTEHGQAELKVEVREEEEEFVPDVDPHMQFNAYGALSIQQQPMMIQQPMVQQPMMQQPMMIASAAPVAAQPGGEERYDEDAADYDDDRYNAPAAYAGGIDELPEGTKLPNRGRWFLILVLLILIAGYVVIIFASVRNNGIFHFGRIMDTLNVTLNDSEPMEIKAKEVERTAPDFEPIKSNDDKPSFTTAISRPTGIQLANDRPILILYGNITNTSNKTYRNVKLQGVIKTSSGGELALTSPTTVLPENLTTELNSADATLDYIVNSGYERADQIDIWANELATQGSGLNVPPNTPMPFILVFTRNAPFEIAPNYLFEVRLLGTELVP